MTPKLTEELANALRRESERNAFAEGLVQMEAGEGKPAERAFEEIRTRLKFPQPQ